MLKSSRRKQLYIGAPEVEALCRRLEIRKFGFLIKRLISKICGRVQRTPQTMHKTGTSTLRTQTTTTTIVTTITLVRCVFGGD